MQLSIKAPNHVRAYTATLEAALPVKITEFDSLGGDGFFTIAMEILRDTEQVTTSLVAIAGSVTWIVSEIKSLLKRSREDESNSNEGVVEVYIDKLLIVHSRMDEEEIEKRLLSAINNDNEAKNDNGHP